MSGSFQEVFSEAHDRVVKSRSGGWDGSAARADALRYAGGNIASPAAQRRYASFFLVCDGDPSNVGSYKFPYKRLRNGTPTVDPDGWAAAKAAAHGARSGQPNASAQRAAGQVRKNLLPSSETGYRGSASSHPDGREFEKSVDGGPYAQNPPVPSAGAGTQPRDEGGRFQSAQYQGGTGADFARQPSAVGVDGNPPGSGYDTEAAASHGYGRSDPATADKPPTTGGFDQAVRRPPQGIANYRLHVVNPRLNMLAAEVARNAVTEFGIGPEGQPVATSRFNPNTVDCPDDLNVWTFREMMHKIHALTATFHDMTGRWPIVGGPANIEDEHYRVAFQQIVDSVYGPDATLGTWLQ